MFHSVVRGHQNHIAVVQNNDLKELFHGRIGKSGAFQGHTGVFAAQAVCSRRGGVVLGQLEENPEAGVVRAVKLRGQLLGTELDAVQD